MRHIGTVLFENAGWIIEDEQHQMLMCRLGTDTPVLVLSQVSDEGECIVGRDIKIMQAGVLASNPMSECETVELLKQIIRRLTKAGFSARISD